MHNKVDVPCRQCPSCGTPLETWFQSELIQQLKIHDSAHVAEQPQDVTGLSPAPLAFVGRPDHEPVEVAGASDPVQCVQRNTPTQTYRPALRAYLTEWFFVTVCALTAFFIEDLLLLLLGEAAVMKMSDWPWAMDAFSLAALLGLIYYGGKIAFSWMANRFYLKPNAIESSVGIIARNTSSVRYSHVRSVEIIQGIVDRLLDTGRIELATAGSADIEIVFSRVAHPVAIKTEINHRILAAGQKGD